MNNKRNKPNRVIEILALMNAFLGLSFFITERGGGRYHSYLIGADAVVAGIFLILGSLVYLIIYIYYNYKYYRKERISIFKKITMFHCLEYIIVLGISASLSSSHGKERFATIILLIVLLIIIFREDIKLFKESEANE